MISIAEIPVCLLERWQSIADLAAGIISVPAALIMKTGNECMEVLISSKTTGNPYHPGDSEKLLSFYCGTVIKTQKELLIPDVRADSHWYKIPDVKPAMISYLGYPINTPDNRPLGTLCVLDKKVNTYSPLYAQLLRQLRDTIECDIALLQERAAMVLAIAGKQKTESVHRKMVSNISDVIVLIDKNGIVRYKSPNIEKLFGWKVEELIGKSALENIHPEDAGELQVAFFEKMNAPDATITAECRYRCKDGTFKWIKITATNRLNDPDICGILGNYQDITQRKTAENAIRESEEMHRILVENANEIVYYVSIEGLFTYISPNWQLYMGEPAEDAIGKSFKLYVHPEDAHLYQEFLRTVLKTGKKQNNFECRVRHFDGTWRWHVTNGVPLKDSAGNVSGYMGVARDVTMQKQSDELLHNERKQLISIFDSIDESIYVADTNTYELLFANQALVRSLGKNPVGAICYRELQGKSVPCEFCTNEIILKRSPNSYSWEHYNPALNRTYVLHDRIIRWPDGRDVRLELAVDITAQKNVEERLAAEKERLSVTLRSIGDGVITTDVNGNIILMNKVAEELTGWKQNEAEGKNLDSVFTIINEITREPHENPAQKVLTTGAVIELANHTLMIARDGTERIIADSGAPIKDKDGHIIGVVLVFRDMTEKQRFLDITQNSQKLESLGVLAGGIAHDFNNLLGGIYGYIDMASGEVTEGETVSRYLSKAMSTIDRARDLTRQLLTFAKGGAPLQKVEKVFPFVLETVQFALSGASVTCNFNVPDDLWSCYYDKNQIGQVIDNLVINAIQAMPMGGKIVVTARNITLGEKEHPVLSNGDYVCVSIKDSGIGIPREILSRIFDPFFTTKSKGHGLGLATCYSIVNRHGGCIDVGSAPGKGTVFQVYLPAAEVVSASVDKQTTVQHRGRGTFVVMDDEEVMREILKGMLKSFGYDVVCKNNGRDAVDYFNVELKANRQISGMIFDLTVPGEMGGMEAVAEVRKTNSRIPVFVSSGYADGPVMKNPAEYGFTASICKPFRQVELMEILQKHMILTVP